MLTTLLLVYVISQLTVGKSEPAAVGLLASLPLLADSELVQAEDEALYSFTCGSFCYMTKYRHFILFVHKNIHTPVYIPHA